MKEEKEYLDRFMELETDAMALIWECSTDAERDIIRAEVWENPVFILEGKKLYSKKSKKKTDKKLSMKAKSHASKQRKEKQKRARKMARIFKRIDKLQGQIRKLEDELEKEELQDINESFSNFLTEAEKPLADDSRGPHRLLVLAKNGPDGRAQLRAMSAHLYDELGVSTWVEEGPYGQNWGEENTPRDYGLFVSLHSYGPEEVAEVEKEIKSLAKKAD